MAKKNVSIAPPIDTQTIVIKNSLSKGKVPSAADLVIGELALSLYKGEESIWAKNSNGEVVKLNEVTIDDLWSSNTGVFKSYSSWEQLQSDIEEGIIGPENIVFLSDTEITKRGIWTQNQFFDTSINSEDFVKVTDLATVDKDGLLSKEDFAKLGEIGAVNLPLVSPEVSGRWSIYNHEGYKVGSRDENDIELEAGFSAKWVGTYRWNIRSGYKNPEKLSDDSEWHVLTEPGAESDEYTSPRVSTDASFDVTLMAPKTGYTVDEKGCIIPAEGLWDTQTASASVTFKDRVYYGKIKTKTPTPDQIVALGGNFQDGTETFVTDISCDEDEYFVYAYPKHYGSLTYIIQDYALSVKGAFSEGTLTITNDSGYEIELYVYVSNHPGAFTLATLNFK